MSRWLSLRGPLDRAVALGLLLALMPVGVLCMLAARLDGGPSLIRVRRVGQGGRSFGMLKFRSMRAARPDGLAGGPALTGQRDPRVTPVGLVLRRYRLDELPQLVHVLSGEMALIGPRPEAPEFVDVHLGSWSAVLDARPGIAGLSQVLLHEWEIEQIGGGDAADPYRSSVLPVKLAVDRWYVEHANPLLDLEVMLAAVGSVLGRRPTRLARRIGNAVPELAMVQQLSA